MNSRSAALLGVLVCFVVIPLAVVAQTKRGEYSSSDSTEDDEKGELRKEFVSTSLSQLSNYKFLFDDEEDDPHRLFKPENRGDAPPDPSEEIDLTRNLRFDYVYMLDKLVQISNKRKMISEHYAISKLAELAEMDIDVVVKIVLEAAETGLESARLVEAKLNFFGDFIPANVDRAFAIFNELAANGNSDAHFYLGVMYSAGLGPLKTNQAKSLLHFTFASMNNVTLANIALGYRYHSGISVHTNCESALSYYRKAAKRIVDDVTFSGSVVISRIRLYDESEQSSSGVLDEDLIQYYQFLADKGDVQAQVGLGQLHFQGGRGVELDPDRAFHYFKLAAENGNTNAMAYIGKMYLEGNKVVKKNPMMAYQFFKKAAINKNPLGLSGLGVMFLEGRGVTVDYGRAFKYFSLAATQGWVDGQIYLGIMYLKGYGVAKDPKTAMKFFSMASATGHILSFYYIAEMHVNGMTPVPSCSTAVDLFKSVSERGVWGTSLMEAHSNHRAGRRSSAYVKYATLSELGYEVAQSNVAFMLDRQDVPNFVPHLEIYTRAFLYLTRSAMQGSSTSRLKLGDYFYYGLGTDIDFEMAANQYQLAAENQGSAQALFNLGYMYENGIGLKRDLHLAKRFYDMAATTASEAHVPVTLALVKLFFVIIYDEAIAIYRKMPDFHFWELFLVTLLIMIFTPLFFLRFPTTPPQPVERPTPTNRRSEPSASSRSQSATGSSEAGTTSNGDNNRSSTTSSSVPQPSAPSTDEQTTELDQNRHGE